MKIISGKGLSSRQKTKNKKSNSTHSKSKFSPNRKPELMSLTEWQTALRRQAAETEYLQVRAVDGAREGYFSVHNPKSSSRYRVVFRGVGSPWNYCSCPDFKTNQLGTCKHIESVVLANSGKYANRLYYNTPDCTTVYLDYKGEQRVRIRIGSEHRKAMSQLAAEYFDADNALRDDMFARFGDFLSKARELDPSTRCFDDALDFIISRREDVRRNQIADTTKDLFEGLMRVPLYPYQREGAEFAFRRGRCIIADEMGLGKTIQAIACAMLLKRQGLAESVWVVCPTSLKYQWKTEIRKFTDEEALVVEGNVVVRKKALAAPDPLFKIVSYHSLVNSIQFGLDSMPSMIIYDEVQRLKNWDTKMAKTMRRLKSDYVVAISGTPLENKLSELYSVMQLVDQFVLGPYWRFVDETTITDETGKIVGYKNLNRVGDVLKSVLIRRTKKSVRLQMPARIDKNLFVTMTREQRIIHDDCKFQLGVLVRRWRHLRFLSEKDRLRMMQLMSMMRMSCDSTFIIDQTSRHDTKIDEAINIINDVIESGDEKIVIFSQWERMQRIMAEELEKHNIGFRFLHGGVPSARRGAIIDDFINDPECRVFLSTDAGSTGLNLQKASIVINFDLPWNPAVLEQRIGRAYRLGQDRQVQVINMVATDTIEHRMLGTLAFKTDLFEGVLDGGDDSIALSDEKFSRIASFIDEELDAQSDPSVPDNSTSPDDNTDGATVDYSDDSIDDYEDPDSNFDDSDEAQYTEDFVPDSEPDEDEDADDSPDKADETANTTPDSVDAMPDEDAKPTTSDRGSDSDNTDSGAELISKGLEFLGGLAKAIATPETRRQLVDSIVKEDPSTGRTTLSIPVSSKETVANILELVTTALQSLKK